MKRLALLQSPLHQFWGALAIFVLNFILKALYLGSQDIAMDEPFTLFWAQQPVSSIWELAMHENNPPLHFLVEHFWIQWFGIGPWSVRFPSLLFSCLAAAVIFLVAHRRFGWLAGLGGSLLFTLSTEQVYHSHEARTYALLGLLTALSAGALLRVLEEPGRPRGYLWLCVWNILLIYSHFLGIWMLIAEGLLVLVSAQRRILLPRMALVYLGIVAAYAPNLVAFLSRLKSVSDHATWVPKPHWTHLYGHVNIFWNGKWATVAFILVVVAGLWGLWRRKRSGTAVAMPSAQVQGWMALGILFCTLYFGIYLQSLLFTPAFIPRYLVWVSVPFFLWVAATLQVLLPDGRWQAGAWCAITLSMLPGFSLNPGNERSVKPMVAFVQEVKTPGALVIVAPDYWDKTYVYHADLPLFQDAVHWPEAVRAKGIIGANGFGSLPTQVLDTVSQVVFVDADVQSVYPGNGIKNGLEARFALQEHRHFEKGIDVWVFQRVVRGGDSLPFLEH